MIELSDYAVLDRVLEPVTNCFTPDVARRIAELRADPELQARLDELAGKANNGELTEDEQRQHHELIEAIDLMGILQSKARAVLASTDSH